MTDARFEPSGPLRGSLRPPSDKSISHRAALIAAMGEGETEIVDYLDAADTRSTLGAIEALGVRVHRVGSEREVSRLRIDGSVHAVDLQRFATIDPGDWSADPLGKARVQFTTPVVAFEVRTLVSPPLAGNGSVPGSSRNQSSLLNRTNTVS